MPTPFYKYHGTGNDFIVVDDRPEVFPEKSTLISRLCDRHLGIGADGLILIRPDKELDFAMDYYNADGEPGSMCGNGARCTVHLAKRLGVIGKPETTFRAFDGPHQAILTGARQVRVQMGNVDTMQQLEKDTFLLDTGSPHYVRFTTHVEDIDIASEGRRIRNSPAYHKAGINVNFAVLDEDAVQVRTYERGVEAETLSCGTGVVATALAAHGLNGALSSPVEVLTHGGTLRVYFTVQNGGYTDIYLEGPVTPVYVGEIDLE